MSIYFDSFRTSFSINWKFSKCIPKSTFKLLNSFHDSFFIFLKSRRLLFHSICLLKNCFQKFFLSHRRSTSNPKTNPQIFTACITILLTVLSFHSQIQNELNTVSIFRTLILYHIVHPPLLNSQQKMLYTNERPFHRYFQS